MSNIFEMNELLCEQLRQKTSFAEVELISSVLIDVICEVFSGEMLYIPNRKKYGKRQALRQKFNGKNHRELAHEFGYTVRNVYEILSNKKLKQLDIQALKSPFH
jgi:Mor family transcriptional regulator